MLARVDDCDITGDNDELLSEILAVCKAIWNVEVVSSDFILGIRRRVTVGNDGTAELLQSN